MTINVLPNVPPADIPLDNGHFPLWPAEKIRALDRTALRIWCHKYARYGLPSLEFIQWLNDYFGNSKAIEIGAGAADFAYHLGIPATDNRIQEQTDVAMFYALTGQPIIKYPDEVEKLDALEAIEEYNPDIAFGSWLTQWVDPNLPPPPGGGSVYGLHEDKILETGVTYMLLGNEAIHGQKKIMKAKHTTINLPFLCSRATYPELDRIYIWNE